MVCTLTRVGEYRKYQHSVSGVPLGCALGNSLELMIVFPCTPLLSSRYRLSTLVQYNLVLCRYSAEQCSTVQGIWTVGTVWHTSTLQYSSWQAHQLTVYSSGAVQATLGL